MPSIRSSPTTMSLLVLYVHVVERAPIFHIVALRSTRNNREKRCHLVFKMLVGQPADIMGLVATGTHKGRQWIVVDRVTALSAVDTMRPQKWCRLCSPFFVFATE